MKKRREKTKRGLILKSLGGGLLAILGAQAYRYAAPPARPKTCDFAYPADVAADAQTQITVSVPADAPDFIRTGGFTNDASCLNKTPVFGIAKIASENDVRNALRFAREHGLKVTSAGQQHSMGGQSFVRNGLVLDMKGFKRMSLDKEHAVLTVESGALWVDVQAFLDPQGFAVKAMQSINIFTVGGTLSVNAHGIAHDPGQIAPTVRSLRVMTADGEVRTASPAENPELFRAVLGGYGLAGVILDARLDVVKNETYAWTREFMDYKDFPAYYAKNIEHDPEIGLFYGRLSVSPTSYLTQALAHVYRKTDFEGQTPSLQVPTHTWVSRLVINFSKTGGFGRWVRWILETYLEPKLHFCSHNSALNQKEACIVSRNQEMYDAMGYLKNNLKDTDILQEYFIPHENMVPFVDGLRNIVGKDGANLLNVTIRIVRKDTITSLPYAKEDSFAFVLYFNQKLNERDSEILKKTTVDLIDLATSLRGTYYLPYQLYYSPAQLRAAYPEIDAFFAEKKKLDPAGIFTNTFYEKYGKR